MLTLTKVLVIVLLHLLKCSLQTQQPLYPSTYWKTTYVSDKVPDYWNHGIYAPKLPESKKEDIFPAWLVKSTTEPSQITDTTAIEDYDIEIFKTSTDKVFSINNAEIEKETEKLKADLAPHKTMTETDWTELTSTVPSVITRTAKTKTNSIINSIFATTTPTIITSTQESISNSIITDSIHTTTAPKKNDLTRPEYNTTIDDDDDTHPPLITVNTSITTSAEKSISYSIITDIYVPTTPKTKKKVFTRPEYATNVDHDAHPPFITMNSSVITSTEESISESILTESTTQTSEKNDFTRPEYETSIDDDDAQPPLTTMNPNIIITIEETKSNSIITDSIFTKTAPATEYEKTVDDGAHPILTTTTLTTTTPYDTTFDYAAHPNFTEMTQTASPEYDKTFFYYDANLNKPQKSSTLEFDTTVLDDESQPISTTMTLSSSNPYETKFDYATSISTRITQETSTPEYDSTVHYYGAKPDAVSMTQPTSTPDDSKNYDNEAHYMSKIMTLPSIHYESKFIAAQPKSARMKQKTKTPKYDRPIYARTKRRKKKLSKTPGHISSPKAVPETVIRAVNKEVGTDQFSVFLRKLLIVLSVKRLEDLPLLINQFREYLWMLLTSGQIGKLGLDINSFLAQRVMILDEWPVKAIRKSFDTMQKKLGNRNRELSKDINDILDYMDDTYDEAEEEAMQAVLHETSLFPNSNNNNKIAQGFVDYVFLHPMQRVMGTTRGNVLFGMMTDALKIRDPFKEEHKIPADKDLRKNLHFGKIRKHLSDINRDKVPINKSYKRQFEDSEEKSDSNSDNLSENSKTVKTPNGVNKNEHIDETEGSKETIEKKYYGYKSNGNVVARNLTRQLHRAFTNENKVRKSFSKLRTLRYLNKTKLRTLGYNEDIPQHLARKRSRATTANSANFLETTSNFEMELKAKIYDTLRRMNLVNYSPSRRMRQGIKSTVNEQDDSEETDVERVLKNNIYKAVKKLLN